MLNVNVFLSVVDHLSHTNNTKLTGATVTGAIIWFYEYAN